jgi:hypothetical protein
MYETPLAEGWFMFFYAITGEGLQQEKPNSFELNPDYYQSSDKRSPI